VRVNLRFQKDAAACKQARMSADDASDLEMLYGVHRTDLMRFLIARVGDQAEADDLSQELWMRAKQHHGGPIGNGRAYLYRMAQNLVVDRIREQQRRMARERRWSDEATDFTAAGLDPVDGRRTAEEEILAREEVAALTSAVSSLPDGARKAFEMHKLHGLSHSQVAEKMGISKSGVEKHMAVAMKYLRRALLD
jgi:RNA polymerase sigma-70 factor (ECF subfamily)